MCNQRFRQRTANLAVIMTLVISSTINVKPAFAQYRHQVAQMCQDKVNAKGLKGDPRKAEYQKCRLDPIGYK
jgi:hypothetical protein